MLIMISTLVIIGFVTSYIFRRKNISLLLSYVIPPIIAGTTVCALSFIFDGLYENPTSLIENSRGVFLSFLGTGLADLCYSLEQEIRKFSSN